MVRKNDIEMHSLHNEEKSAAAERFLRTLKDKICKYMISISRNVYIDRLDDIVNKYNNKFHSTTKMKPVNVEPNTYIWPRKEISYQDREFKIGDIVRIPKYISIFTKNGPNWSEEVFVIKKVENTVQWT